MNLIYVTYNLIQICLYTLIYILQNELKNLEDACDEISLLDEDAKIPYHIGEVFIYEDLERTQV